MESLRARVSELEKEREELSSAYRRVTGKEPGEPEGPGGLAMESLATVLQAIAQKIGESHAPKMEKFYQLPKVLEKPTLSELRLWMEEVEVYVTKVPSCLAQGLDNFLQGRMKGHFKRITAQAVSKAKAEGTYSEDLACYQKLWRDCYGLLDSDDYARMRLESTVFTGGSLSEHTMKVQALYAEMIQDPMPPRDKVRTFLSTIKVPGLADQLKYNPLTARKWEGETQWEDLCKFVLERYTTQTFGQGGQKRKAHEEEREGNHAGGSGGNGSHGAPKSHGGNGHPYKKHRDGKWPRRDGGKHPQGDRRSPPGKGSPSKSGEPRRLKIPPGSKAFKFYAEKDLCFTCGEPFTATHQKGQKCPKKPAFPKDFPPELKKEVWAANKK